MQVYQSRFLEIEQRGKLLVQHWTNAPLSPGDFRRELSVFMKVFSSSRPELLLWDNQHCNLKLDPSLGDWLGENVLVPVHQKGVRELVLTMPEELEVHLSILEGFEQSRAIMQPKFFAERASAENYLLDGPPKLDNAAPIADCRRAANSEVFDVRMQVAADDLPRLLSSVQRIPFERAFVTKHAAAFRELTRRELEVFERLANGFSNKEIANNLFIEESSVKTHRKHINKKLSLRSPFDLYQYARCFRVIR